MRTGTKRHNPRRGSWDTVLRLAVFAGGAWGLYALAAAGWLGAGGEQLTARIRPGISRHEQPPAVGPPPVEPPEAADEPSFAVHEGQEHAAMPRRIRRHALRSRPLLGRLWGWLQAARRRPHRRAAPNPRRVRRSAAAASATFHGTPRHVRTVRGRPHVVLGTLEEIQYRAPAASQRAGTTWRHRAGDVGGGRPRLRGRALLVADPQTGDLDIAGGPARFVPERGVVG